MQSSKLKITNKNSNLFDRIYKVVGNIPEGKVATYGQVAELIGIRDARKIGWALHANKDRKTPCHRVVNKKGKVADTFAFGGSEEQKRLLVSEGVEFIDQKHVNLDKHRWQGKM